MTSSPSLEILNDGLRLAIVEQRQKGLKKRKEHARIKAWKEQIALLDGSIVDSLAFVLPTRGCYLALSKLGGCSMCNYLFDNPSRPQIQQLAHDFKNVFHKYLSKITTSQFTVKLYSSGSILDPAEIPTPILKDILQFLDEQDRVVEITIETLPKFITPKRLNLLREWVSPPSKLELAIGMETSSDMIRINSINKGFTWNEFKIAVQHAHEAGMRVKAYVLVKPPFLSEFQALQDAIQSARDAINLGIQTISFNLTNIPKYSYIEQLFYRKQYRPPWLWTGVTAVRTIKQEFPSVRIICDPVAAGQERGAHNCFKCDRTVASALHQFTLTQDPALLDPQVLTCSCYEEYQTFLLIDHLSNAGGVFSYPSYLGLSRK